jgi:hypothetical protein
MNNLLGKRHQIKQDGRIIELETFDVDPSWRSEWFVLGLAIGFLLGLALGLWLDKWPWIPEIMRPYLECPGFGK